MTTPRKRPHVHGEMTPPKLEEAEWCRKAIEYVEAQRTYKLTLADRLDILRLQATLRLNRAEFPGQPPVVATRLLGRAEKTVKSIWKEFKSTNSLVDHANMPSPPKTRSRTRRINANPKLLEDLRDFIRQRAAARQRTVAKDVLSFFVTKTISK
jgi:hypothetical protein